MQDSNSGLLHQSPGLAVLKRVAGEMRTACTYQTLRVVQKDCPFIFAHRSVICAAKGQWYETAGSSWSQMAVLHLMTFCRFNKCDHAELELKECWWASQIFWKIKLRTTDWVSSVSNSQKQNVHIVTQTFPFETLCWSFKRNFFFFPLQTNTERLWSRKQAATREALKVLSWFQVLF